MRAAAVLFALVAAAGSGAAAYFIAGKAVSFVEQSTKTQLDTAIAATGDTWATIETDGLIVNLTGEAPNEEVRFRALQAIGRLVASDRIADQTTVQSAVADTVPDFTLEILRNEDQVSLIGLVPADLGRDEIMQGLADITQTGAVVDMLDSAAYEVPENWATALDFGLMVTASLPRAKISVTPGTVAVTAVVNDITEQAQLEEELQDVQPDGVELDLNISAPRPVITPFVFNLELAESGATLRVCAAETEEDKDVILAASRTLGAEGPCDIGLGAPSPRWSEAVGLAVASLGQLGAGSVEFRNADITLVGPRGTDAVAFSQQMRLLREALPPIFSLSASFPPAETAEDDTAPPPPRFVAQRAQNGGIRLEGILADGTMRSAVTAFAEASFGSGTVVDATTLRADTPDGWSRPVLAGIEALSLLRTGQLVVTEDTLALSGTAVTERIRDEIRSLLAENVPSGVETAMNVAVNEQSLPQNAPRLAARCSLELDALLELAQITFPSSSTEIAEESNEVIQDIATILRACPGARFEVAGHTDSQGREQSNMALSQSRADAVVDALLKQGITQVFLSSQGYGETQPISDNETDDGRARNRRIEFNLVDDTDAVSIDDAESVAVEASSDVEVSVDTPDTASQDEQAAEAASEEGASDVDAEGETALGSAAIRSAAPPPSRDPAITTRFEENAAATADATDEPGTADENEASGDPEATEDASPTDANTDAAETVDTPETAAEGTSTDSAAPQDDASTDAPGSASDTPEDDAVPPADGEATDEQN